MEGGEGKDGGELKGANLAQDILRGWNTISAHVIEEDVKRLKSCPAKTQLCTQQLRQLRVLRGSGTQEKAISMRNLEVRRIIRPSKWKKLFRPLCVAVKVSTQPRADCIHCLLTSPTFI